MAVAQQKKHENSEFELNQSRNKVGDLKTLESSKKIYSKSEIDIALSYDSIYYFQSGKVGIPLKKPAWI